MIDRRTFIATALVATACSRTARARDDAQDKAQGNMSRISAYAFSFPALSGGDIRLAEFSGRPLLIVNTASQCGYTPQYTELEELYHRYKDKGLVLLGFPANNFGWQEPGTDAEIKTFCTTKYNVTFDMFSKISVKGSDQHPLYAYLTSEDANPETAGGVKWNFTKYLVDKNGRVLAKFGSGTTPLSEEIVKAVEAALK